MRLKNFPTGEFFKINCNGEIFYGLKIAHYSNYSEVKLFAVKIGKHLMRKENRNVVIKLHNLERVYRKVNFSMEEFDEILYQRYINEELSK
jgi:hypothetical protein